MKQGDGSEGALRKDKRLKWGSPQVLVDESTLARETRKEELELPVKYGTVGVTEIQWMAWMTGLL